MEAAKGSLRAAFDRTTRWFANLLAPLIVLTYAKDVQQAFDYLVERPVLASAFALLFLLVFSYNIAVSMRSRPREIAPQAAQSTEQRPIEGHAPELRSDDTTTAASAARRGQALLRWGAIIGSLAALILVAYVYVLVFVTGIYYVAVASAPDRPSAMREVQYLNQFLEAKGYDDLVARAHPSTATGNPWYMISIGGWHASKEAAQETLEKAKAALGAKMRSDAYIYSTENISPVRVLMIRMRRLFSGSS